MRKMIGLAISVMVLISLIGCSSSKENKPANSSAPKDSSNAPNSTEAVKEESPLELSIFINAPADTNLPDNPADDFVRTAIEEKFNVKLKVDYDVVGETYNSQINARFAGGNPPDMWRDSNQDGGQKYAADGLLADQSQFVTPATMPNYFKYWMQEDEYARYQLQTLSGSLRSPMPINRNSYAAFYIREDWLKQVGLPVPTNYDQYLDVLRAFRNDDPDQNGAKDTYGFTTSGDGTTMSLNWPERLKHGLTGMLVEDNTFIDDRTDPRIQFVVDDIVKVINEDLVDPDWFLNNDGQALDKAVQGKVGIIRGNTAEFAYDSNPQSLQNRTRELSPNAEWVPFKLEDGSPLGQLPSLGHPFLFPKQATEKNPEKVERIVAILDWLASEEGFLLTHYGIEGKHYTRSGDTITLDPDALEQDLANKGKFLGIWGFFTPLTPEVYELKVIDPRMTDRDRTIYEFVTSQPVGGNMGTNVAPPAGFDLGAFRTKMNEYHVQMIFDDKSGDKWPQYREDLMTTYKGQLMMDSYTEQIKGVGLIK